MKFLINNDVYAKVMYLVHKCDKEISGLGRVKIEGDTVRIVDMCLLDQEVSGTTTDIKPDAVSKALFDAYKDGGLAQGELLWWWHSHVNMGVFWSGTDMATIKEFGGKGRLFATVFNKKAEMRSAYFQAGNDTYPEVFVDQIATDIDFGLTDAVIKQLDKEFKAKVKEKKWSNPHYPNWNRNKPKKSKKKGKQVNHTLLDDKWNDSFWWEEDLPVSFWEDDYWGNTPMHKKLVTSGGNDENGNK